MLLFLQLRMKHETEPVLSNIPSPYCHTGRLSKPHLCNVSPPPGDFTMELIIALVFVAGKIALDEGKSTASYWVLFN